MRVFAVHILSAGVSLDFRSRLLRTLRAVEPILAVQGVLVVGSEVPNLLEPNARSSLVVSQDVDIAVPVASHADVKARLPQLHGLSPFWYAPRLICRNCTDHIGRCPTRNAMS